MSLLCINICSSSKYRYYVITLYVHDLKMIEHIHKYFQDFYDFISQVIMSQSQRYQTLETFFEALYIHWTIWVGGLIFTPYLQNSFALENEYLLHMSAGHIWIGG